MRTRNKILLAVAILVVGLLVVVEGTKLVLDSRYYAGYRPTSRLNARVEAESNRLDYRRVKVYYQGLMGEEVPAVLTLPHDAPEPVPCIIFLHGIGQNKDFIDEIAAPFVREGFAMATFDQYTRGERRLADPSRLDQVLALRRRGVKTVIETRRLIDYLQTRPDIAGDRIYLVGASYGAITGCTAAAFDERIRAVVLVYGGGNLPLLLNNRASREALGKWRGLVTTFSAWLVAPSDPIRYAARIAPRPILFQNGTDDSLIPTAAAEALFEAAREPKSITWYEGDHIGLDRETVEKVLAEALNWLKKQDAQRAGDSAPATATASSTEG